MAVWTYDYANWTGATATPRMSVDYTTDNISFTLATTWADTTAATFNDLALQFRYLSGTTQQFNTVIQPLISWYDVQPTVAPLTPEQLDQRLRDTRAAQRKQKIVRQRAIRKGRKLLLSMLDDLQRHQYAKHGQFTVHGADGKIYVLRKSGTVHELDEDGRAAWSHCIHLAYSFVDEDTLIAQKMMLETDPASFRKIANTNKIYVPDAPAVTTMELRQRLVRSGPDNVAEHLASLWNVAARERYLADRIQRAASYAEYARELEAQVVAEEHHLAIPNLSARQKAAARLLGHSETIAGEAVAA